MTPQEIFGYKQKWLPGVEVVIHSDRRQEAKSWCKQNLEQQRWSFHYFTNVYEDSFYFELEAEADRFRVEFSK